MIKLNGNIFISIEMQGVPTFEVSRTFAVTPLLEREGPPTLYQSDVELSEADSPLSQKITEAIERVIVNFAWQYRADVVKATIEAESDEAISNMGGLFTLSGRAV